MFMKPDNNYKTLVCKFGNVLLDEDIYYRVHGTEKPRPYHKFKMISSIVIENRYVRCSFAKRGKLIQLSRLLMNAKKGEIIDHINRNPLDNRRSNLRKVNSRQNTLNRKSYNNTGFFGVSSWKRNGLAYLKAYFKSGKIHEFNASDSPFNRIICAFAHDKFVLQAGDEEYAPLNFPCWKFEPFKTILLKENLNEYLEKSYRKNRIS